MPNVVQSIKDNISITDYAQMLGYHVKEVTPGRWTLEEHDSVNINMDPEHPGQQRFIWNSRQMHGSVIDFAMAANGCSQEEAISELRRVLGGKSGEYWREKRSAAQRSQPIRAAPTALELPELGEKGMARIYAYLCKTRGLDSRLLGDLIHNKQLYQDGHGNAVFVGYDYDQKAKYCTFRGTLSEVSYRGEGRGSRKEIGFSMGLVGEQPTRLMVCEAPIDAISLASMLEHYGRDSHAYAYLALGGTAPNALMYHLEHHPQLKTIYLCQDSDAAGLASREKCRQLLKEKGFAGKIIDKLPVGKDFNEDLLQIRAAQKPQHTQQPSPAKEPVMAQPR